MRKLGTDRPDLLVRSLDESAATKEATHFFHQLGSSLGRGTGNVAADAMAGAAAPMKWLGLPRMARGMTEAGNVASNVLKGTGTVAGGLTDAVATPAVSLLNVLRKFRKK